MKITTYNRQLFPFESKWMETDGNRIHYIDEGAGPVLLFCHPSIATSFMYRRFIKELSHSYRCIALDFPGFGLSTAAQGYGFTIQSQSVIVEKLIRNLKLENIHPIVQEIGGHAALTALSRMPEKVRGIILTDTIIFPISGIPKFAKFLKLVNGSVFTFLNTNFNFLIRATYRFGIRKRKLSKEERRVYKDMFDTRQKRRRITQMLYQLVLEEDLMKGVKRSFETVFANLPVLLIYGDKDEVYKLGMPQMIQNLVRNTELHLIKGEAHFPHEGAPDEMISIIEKWMYKQV